MPEADGFPLPYMRSINIIKGAHGKAYSSAPLKWKVNYMMFINQFIG